MSTILQQPRYRFLILFIGLYLLFYAFNQAYIGLTAPGGYYIPFLDEHLNYIQWLRDFLLAASAKTLNLLGHQTKTSMYELLVVGHGKIVLVYSCLGFGVMSFFAAFVLAWPANFKAKTGFLIGGLIIIQLLNILRFVLLGLYWQSASGYIGIDHHFVFNAVLYGIIAAMVYAYISFIKRRDV